jgi:uncharacterized protein (DUF362 family)
MPKTKSKVYVLKTSNRELGIAELMSKFNLDSFSNTNIALKANYNSSDPFPASTHSDTLKNIINVMQDSGAHSITLAERSGMGNTRDVLDKMGVLGLSQELGFKVVVLDEEPKESWQKISGSENHWLKGFYLPKLIFDADKIVQTCCLKTHRFGGQFTLSLKNSVGWVAKKVPGSLYDYMAELHISPYQRRMIAEINEAFNVDLIIMDAIKAFVSHGPEKGKLVEPQLLLASSDRVALDAVGVAILREYGVSGTVNKGPVFEQAQLKKAAELKIGVENASDIELVALDELSAEEVENIQKELINKH